LKSPRILVQRAEEATVLLSLDEGTYFSLNEVGGMIWDLCDGIRTVAQMIDTVAAEFDAPHERVAADVIALVDELASERLLVDAV
jgi:coenzyme PQQ biosynthesis protein PqqD